MKRECLARKRICFLGVAVTMAGLAGSAMAAAVADSSPAFVFLQPEKTALWQTGAGSRFSVPVIFPDGVSTATLTVRGYKYERTYDIEPDDLTNNAYVLELPEAVSPETENVYDLTLTFPGKEPLTARLGGIQGFDASDTGSTRCLCNAASGKWKDIKDHAVLPLPYGTQSLSVNGEVVYEHPAPHAAGWYLLPQVGTARLDLAGMEFDLEANVRDLPGFLLMFR